MDPQTSSTTNRHSTRIRVPVVYTQDVGPFPDGPPTEPAHFDIIRFSSQGEEYLRLGMVDNIVVSLLFSTKRRRPSARIIIPAKLPEQFDAIPMIPKDVTSTIGQLRQRIAAQPADREHWLRCIEQARLADSFTRADVVRDRGSSFRENNDEVYSTRDPGTSASGWRTI
jgi:hypothetical protein